MLTDIGLVSLALGGVSGWLVFASFEHSAWFIRHGVAAPRRFLQVHLDWILMGLLLIAVDVAVPERPEWITAAIAFGTIVNPLLFLPLAFTQKANDNLAFRVVGGLSFTALSVGLVALAVHGI